ncbi:MAG TPA: phosphoglycerate mutase family protein [Acidimicrobiales bacterium]|nr:phosphoglycerate mutase family protein [Acidimicrobiales bacterium]
MPLLLVRHGHAGRRSAFKGDDRLRPLSKRGAAQAVVLVPILSRYRPQRILSSPYLRCRETVEPTAEALSLPVETLDELAEGNGAAAERLIRRMAGQSAVLCTHGDVATAVLEWLVAEGGARPDQERLQKGDAWVIDSAGSSPAIVEHIRLSDRTRR